MRHRAGWPPWATRGSTWIAVSGRSPTLRLALVRCFRSLAGIRGLALLCLAASVPLTRSREARKGRAVKTSEPGSDRVVLDRDDLRRTLSRIAHEIIVESEPRPRLARWSPCRHPHPRRPARAAPAQADRRVLRDGDPAFGHGRHHLLPRRRLGARAARPRSTRSRSSARQTKLDFPLQGRTVLFVDLHPRRLHDPGRGRGALRLRPARPRPGLAVLVDLPICAPPIRPDYVGREFLPTGRDERVYVRLEEIDERRRGLDRPGGGSDHHCPRRGPRMKHLLAIEDLDRGDIGRIMERAASFAEVGRRDIKKVPTLRGTDDRQPLLRGEHAHELVLRARGEAALSRRRLDQVLRAPRSTRESRSRTRSRRSRPTDPRRLDHPLARTRARRSWSPSWTEASGHECRRREARAPQPGPARRGTRCSTGSAPLEGKKISGSSATCSTAGSRARARSASRRWGRR